MTETEITAMAVGRRMSHANQLSRHARKQPNAPALTHAGKTLTYGKLNQNVCALARGFRSLGVNHGDRVAVFMMNSSEVVETYLAVVKLGAIAVPINFRLAVPEVDYVLADSGATVLVTDDELLEVAQGLERIEMNKVQLVHASETPVVKAASYKGLLAYDASEFEVDVAESDPAFIIYTSGTTGRPKGAVLTHLNLLMNSVNTVMIQAISDDNEVWLSGLPLFHIGGLNGILIYLLVGGHTLLMDSGNFRAETAVQMIEENAVTSCYFVPTQWRDICEVSGATKRTASLRRISWGPRLRPRRLWRRWRRLFREYPILICSARRR